MSNDTHMYERHRNRTLLIVEGDHERDVLFDRLIHCFPELNIRMDDVYVYGSNLYSLQHAIVAEYGDMWDQDIDVDLAYVVSKLTTNKTWRNRDFVNIFIVFDFERQDTNYDSDVAVKMQRYFADSTGVGKLLINYPMVESYLDFNTLPDNDFYSRKVSASIRRGSDYKNSVKESIVSKLVICPSRVKKGLQEVLQFGCSDASTYTEKILNSASSKEKNGVASEIISMCEKKKQETAQSYLPVLLKQVLDNPDESFWTYLRRVFSVVIRQNIIKAANIQGINVSEQKRVREVYNIISLLNILSKQIQVSSDADDGYVWVLNTAVFIVADFNISLIDE